MKEDDHRVRRMLGRMLELAANLPSLLCLSLFGAVLISCTTPSYAPTTVVAGTRNEIR